MSAYGLFKDENAALFVEYDGYSDHLTPAGIARDVRKNAALLDFAPAGSFVVRIGRTGRRELNGQVLWVSINWGGNDDESLTAALESTLEQMVPQLRQALRPDVWTSLNAKVKKNDFGFKTSRRVRRVWGSNCIPSQCKCQHV